MAISQMNEIPLVHIGDTKEVLMPGGFTIRIREINGNDEDILSRLGDSQNGTALHKFLASVIVGSSLDRKVTEDDVASWRVRDKYYALYQVRRHSLGDTLTFEYRFQDDKVFGFDYNLAEFDYDFRQGPPPKKGEPGYDPRIIQPYPEEEHYEGTTSKGQKFRFKYLTGLDELAALTRDQANMGINEKLKARHFEVLLPNGTWTKVENFAAFPTRIMSEFRTAVDKYDPDFLLNIELVHPEKRIKETASLFMVADFFFPTV